MSPCIPNYTEETEQEDLGTALSIPSTTVPESVVVSSPTKRTKPKKIDFNVEGFIKKCLGLFKNNIIGKWMVMWERRATSKKLSCDTPYYYHRPEKKKAHVKYFFTEYEYGFFVPTEMYDRNEDFFLYILSILQEKNRKDFGSLNCVNNCLTKCPSKNRLIDFFQNEAIIYLWWNSRQSKFFNSDLMNKFLQTLNKEKKEKFCAFFELVEQKLGKRIWTI